MAVAGTEHTGWGNRLGGGKQGSSDISAYYRGDEVFRINATNFRSLLTMVPNTTDGAALGTTALLWSDLFLASGSVINFNNGDVTLTHVANRLSMGGGDFDMADGNGMVIGNASQIAVSAADGTTSVTPELQVLGVGVEDSSVVLLRTGANAGGGFYMFAKSRNATVGGFTIVANGDTLGTIGFNGDDGVDYLSTAAAIRCVVDGAPGIGDMPGRLEFMTSADAAENPTLRLTINAAGDSLFSDGGGMVIGGLTQVAVSAITPEFQEQGTAAADSAAFLSRWSLDANAPGLFFGKSRGAIGTFTIIVTGDVLGTISAWGADGVDLNSNGNASAEIRFTSSGTIAADRVPGEISLWTATDAAPSVLTQRLTITNAGNVTLGGTTVGTGSPTNAFVHFNGTAPTSSPADSVTFYSSDISAGNTEPSFYCEGTSVIATAQADSASSVRVRMRINGTEVVLLGI